jgi:hypothetical protein
MAAVAKVEVGEFGEVQDGIAVDRRWGFVKLKKRLRVRAFAE